MIAESAPERSRTAQSTPNSGHGWAAAVRGPYGPNVLEFFATNWPIADFFAELGKLLLMFSAGLEIDLGLFRKAQTRALIFGVITTTVPLLLGALYGLIFGYALIPAIVIGSLLASHTLLGLSVVTGWHQVCS